MKALQVRISHDLLLTLAKHWRLYTMVTRIGRDWHANPESHIRSRISYSNKPRNRPEKSYVSAVPGGQKNTHPVFEFTLFYIRIIF